MAQISLQSESHSDQLPSSVGRVCLNMYSPGKSFVSSRTFFRVENKIMPNKKGIQRKNIMLCLREKTFLLEERTLLWQLQRNAGFSTVCLELCRGVAVKASPQAFRGSFAQKNTIGPLQGAPADSPQVPTLSFLPALLHFHLSIPTHSDLCTDLLLGDPVSSHPLLVSNFNPPAPHFLLSSSV